MKQKQLALAMMLVFVAFEPVKSLTAEQMQKMAMGMRSTCMQKISVSEDLVEGIRKGNFPDDANLKCYIQCILKIMRSIRNGAIDFNMVQKQIDASMPPDQAPRLKEVVMKCSKNEYVGDPCQISFDYVNCVYKTDPEVFFFP